MLLFKPLLLLNILTHSSNFLFFNYFFSIRYICKIKRLILYFSQTNIITIQLIFVTLFIYFAGPSVCYCSSANEIVAFNNNNIYNIREPWSYYGVNPLEAKENLENIFSEFAEISYMFEGINENIDSYCRDRTVTSNERFNLNFLKHYSNIYCNNMIEYADMLQNLNLSYYDEPRYISLENCVFQDMLNRMEILSSRQEFFFHNSFTLRQDFDSINRYAEILLPQKTIIDSIIQSYNITNPNIQELPLDLHPRFNEHGIIYNSSWSDICSRLNLLN